MPNDSPMDDPQNIWQHQPTEPYRMSADELRRRAHRHQTRARRKALLGIVLGIVLGPLWGWNSWKAGYLITRLGWAVISLWSFYLAWASYRWMWPARLRPDAEVNTCLEFYRSELAKQRRHLRHIWRRSGLTFCFLGMALLVQPGLIQAAHHPGLLVNTPPFFVLLLVWFILFYRIRQKQERKARQDIDDLSTFR
jgi:hypothetical protein